MIPAWTDDSTLALLRQGYEFIGRRCDRDGSDVVETRLAGIPVTCLRGPAAAELFYDPARFHRGGPMPMRVRRTLLRMTYRVPPQDLTVSTRRMPTLPASGFVMADVAAT